LTYREPQWCYLPDGAYITQTQHGDVCRIGNYQKADKHGDISLTKLFLSQLHFHHVILPNASLKRKRHAGPVGQDGDVGKMRKIGNDC